MPWRSPMGCPRERLSRERPPGHRPRHAPAIRARPGVPRAAVSGGHGEAQRQRGGDHESLRRGAHHRRHRRRPRAHLRDHRPQRRRAGLPGDGGAEAVAGGAAVNAVVAPQVGPPLWLLLELTYRCPLHCVFCYNPTEFARTGPELSTGEWLRVLGEARALGAVQLGLSGGEPLAREDLEVIVAEAHRLGFYINLITSGIGMTEERIGRLKLAGLDHIQLSFQDSSRELNDFLSSTRTFELKARVAALIRAHDYPMVLNVVLHRHNIDHVGEILDMAERMGAQYVELANTQYYGWAWLNREELLPTRAQLERAEAVTQRYRARLGAHMKIYFVVPDYFETRPKPCMSGLGKLFLAIAPDGIAMPCHAARMLPGLELPSVQSQPLKVIWYDSPAFNRFRGDAWMKEPCRSCPEKHKDFGGCRCQAYLLTGDAANADPVCELSPHHQLVSDAVARAERAVADGSATPALKFRDHRVSIPVMVEDAAGRR